MCGRFLYMATVNKKIVHKVFEETAERFPGRIAIRQAGREISYSDLSRVSDDIAKLLKQVGVKRDVIVGVLLESSITYVAAIIGVMKAGGVFLPLDMSFPEKRLEYILNKTVPQVLISEKTFEAIGEQLEVADFIKNILKGQTCPLILVDQALAEFSNQPSTLRGTSKGAQSLVHNYSSDVVRYGKWSLHPAGWTDGDVSLPDPDPDPNPDDSCYIIYTSDSTEAPKAIEGCYKSLSHFVHWEAKEFGLDEQVRVTQLSPVTFDASLQDIFVPLITGGMLCIPEKGIRTNIKELVRWMAVSGITLIHCVPSLFRMIIKEITVNFKESQNSKDILPELKYILMAGEPLYGKDVTRWMDIVGERVTLVNLYGPSETTLVKTFYPIRQRPANPNAMIPVGYPISNTAILIMKGNMLCEPGEVGDIFIKTPFRTKGYYRDPDLTKISFVPNPLTGDPDDIVVKTGDIGRYLADRGIEFIGRLDTQVKVNGIAYRDGMDKPFLPLRVQYRDYADADWRNVRLEANETQKLSLYWRDKLSGAGSSTLDLPLDFPRPLLQSYMGKSFFFSLDDRLTTGLDALAQKHDVSMFMVTLALVKILLHRYTGQEDIIVGTPIICRNHPDLEDQIGFYANTLALRDLIDGDESFVSVLEKVKKTTMDAYDHQQYPFDWLVRELSLARDTGHAPLFDVMLVYLNEETEDILDAADRSQLRPKDILAAKRYSGEAESGTSRFDLTFVISKSGSRAADSLRIEINYNTDLFRDATIERMATHFSMLAESLLTDTGMAIHKLDILSSAEKRLLTETFNDTQCPYPADKTIVDVFEEQVAKRPDHIAIVLNDREISYRELHERAHGLARVLVEKYLVKPQEIVGLMVDRNEWSIVGLMGIMIAGGVYLPVDPFYPLNRIDYMLSDSGCRLLLTEKKNIENNAQVSSSVMNVDIDTLASACDLFADKPLSHRLSPDDLAYIIYTSGSTGLPKGVMIEHSGFLNMSLHQIKAFGVSDSDRVLQFASASFDAALSEVFMALLAGAAIVVVRKETMYDPLLFVRYLEEKRVTCVTLPPVYLNALDKESLNTVTTIITAGEAPNTGDAVSLSGRKHYFNAYGPTEISVCATIERVSPNGDYRRNIPIGKPISNTAIYILDDSLNLVPIGIPGEICISGAGLARGYLNRPELTLEKFVRHPFRVGERLYRTGDIGRWLPEGVLEWLGRNDDQVKIRGYRIELGEIKNALLRHASVKDAIVIAGGRDVEPASGRHGTEELTAYFTARERLEPADLISYLGRFLPSYMVPLYLIQLEDIPMTAHGKVDRKALANSRASQNKGVRAAKRYSGNPAPTENLPPAP